MGIVSRIKSVTPRQWAIVVGAAGAAGLGIDYYRRREGSLVGRLVGMFHHHHELPHAPPHAPRGGGGGGARPQVAPMPSQLPMSAVMYPESGVPIPPEVWAPVYGGVPYYAHYYSPHGTSWEHFQRGEGRGEGHGGGWHEGHGGGGHHAGAPGPTDGVKQNVPPPGSHGIVAVTPPAASDPGAWGVPQNGNMDAAPCGAGLVYDAASQRCVPYPTTPPYGGW